MLPEAAQIAEAADIFLERGNFDAAQARRYLTAAREHGLRLRIHGDQFSEMGAVPLAVELGAVSVDHLEVTGPEGVAALAASGVAGVLLPIAALYLRLPMPPARDLIDRGAVVALATDFNPGSAFCESLPIAWVLPARSWAWAPGRPSPPARSTRPTCSVGPTISAGWRRVRRRRRPARSPGLALPRLPSRHRPRRRRGRERSGRVGALSN